MRESTSPAEEWQYRKAVASLFALLSSLTGGSASFLGGLTTRRLSVYAVTGFGALFAGLIYALVLTGQHSWSLSGPEVAWGAVSGVCALIGNLAFYTALSKGRMGVISGITSLSVLVPIAFDVVQGIYPNPGQLLGIAACIGGVIVVSAPELRGSQTGAMPLVLAAVATVSYGLIFVTLGLGSESSALETSAVMEATIVIPLAIAAIFTRSLGGVSKRIMLVLLAIGFLDAASTWSYSFSTTIGMVALDSVLASLAPVITTILAAVILKQVLKPVQYMAILVILAGVALVTLA